MPHNRLPLFKDCAVELNADETRTIKDAVHILERKLTRSGACLTRPSLVADYLKLHIATKPYEVFVCVFSTARTA